VVHFLQAAFFELEERGLTAYNYDWDCGAHGIGYSGNGVCEAGPGRHDSHPGFACNARPPVGGVCGCLFVTDVNNAYARFDTTGINRLNVSAA
jgi:hypothetical protein